MKNYVNQNISCPYCGKHTQVELDIGNEDQELYQDCNACCNSIHLKVHRDEVHNKIQLFVDADDEQYY